MKKFVVTLKKESESKFDYTFFAETNDEAKEKLNKRIGEKWNKFLVLWTELSDGLFKEVI